MIIFFREFSLFFIVLILPVNNDFNQTPVFSFSRLSDRAFRWDTQVSWTKNFSVQRHSYVEPHWTQNHINLMTLIMLRSLMDARHSSSKAIFLRVFTTKTAQLYQCNTKLRSEHETGDIIPVSIASNILWIIFFYVGNFLAFNRSRTRAWPGHGVESGPHAANLLFHYIICQ